MYALPRKQNAPDLAIVCFSIALTLFGLIMIYSSSAIIASERFGDSLLFLTKQTLWIILGFILMLITMNINFMCWQKYARIIVLISLSLLMGVLFLGTSVGGTQRWFSVGPFNFQPSEFAKLALVIGIADYIDRKKSRMRLWWKGYMPGMLMLMVFCGLILAEKDLGTPVLMCFVGGTLFFLSSMRIWHILATIGALIPVVYLVIFQVAYRRERIMTFLNPWTDPQGSGYQIIQSLIAMGSGGFLGKGLGASQAKLLFIPEPYTDFIFSIFSEEMGFIGVLFLVGLYLFFALRGMDIARRSPNTFGSFLASGITLTIIYQALINIAVVSGCLPTKGLPLPFISFGGSSLVFTLAGVGILLNISRYSKE